MALRIRCVHCKKNIPFSRGMLGTRVTCPHCARSFPVDTMPAEGDAPSVPSPSPEAASPAPPAGRPTAAAAITRSDSSAYDLAPDAEPVAVAVAKPLPVKPAPAKPAQVRPHHDGYELKPDPPVKPAVAPKPVVPDTPAADGKRAATKVQKSQEKHATPAEPAGIGESKGLLGWLWKRSAK